MSSIFGKKDAVAKSWSEMFEEDEEESEREQADLEKKREYNSRTWSQESQKKIPVPAGILTETKSRSSLNASRSRARSSGSPPKAGTSPNENHPLNHRAHRRSPTSKSVSSAKWAELGNKRRNLQPEADKAPTVTKRRSMTVASSRKRPGHTYSGSDFMSWHRRDSREKAHPAYLNQDWRQPKTSLESSSSPDEDDHEWVGGWHNFHM